MRTYVSLLCIAAMNFIDSGSSGAETITIFDAACIAKDMKICHSIVKNNPPKEFLTNQIAPPFSAPFRANCVNRLTYQKKSSDNMYPLGCGGDHLAFVSSYSDCPTAGQLNAACVKEMQIMTQSDVDKIQMAFTAQLDAWLKMLENAGAVTLGSSASEPGAMP